MRECNPQLVHKRRWRNGHSTRWNLGRHTKRTRTKIHGQCGRYGGRVDHGRRLRTLVALLQARRYGPTPREVTKAEIISNGSVRDHYR